MARPKSFKTILCETAVLIGLLTFFGHLTVNFWERYMIQSELTQMKSSLHSLKVTLTSIGTAYDKLHRELKGLAELTEQKHDNLPPEKYYPRNTDKHRIQDIQVATRVNTINHGINSPAKANRATERKFIRPETKNAAVMPLYMNMSTMTTYPTNCTGVGTDFDDQMDCCRHEHIVCSKSNCYNNYTCCKDPFYY